MHRVRSYSSPTSQAGNYLQFKGVIHLIIKDSLSIFTPLCQWRAVWSVGMYKIFNTKFQSCIKIKKKKNWSKYWPLLQKKKCSYSVTEVSAAKIIKFNSKCSIIFSLYVQLSTFIVPVSVRTHYCCASALSVSGREHEYGGYSEYSD